jgi:hypothetical protein
MSVPEIMETKAPDDHPRVSCHDDPLRTGLMSLSSNHPQHASVVSSSDLPMPNQSPDEIAHSVPALAPIPNRAAPIDDMAASAMQDVINFKKSTEYDSLQQSMAVFKHTHQAFGTLLFAVQRERQLLKASRERVARSDNELFIFEHRNQTAHQNQNPEERNRLFKATQTARDALMPIEDACVKKENQLEQAELALLIQSEDIMLSIQRSGLVQQNTFLTLDSSEPSSHFSFMGDRPEPSHMDQQLSPRSSARDEDGFEGAFDPVEGLTQEPISNPGKYQDSRGYLYSSYSSFLESRDVLPPTSPNDGKSSPALAWMSEPANNACDMAQKDTQRAQDVSYMNPTDPGLNPPEQGHEEEASDSEIELEDLDHWIGRVTQHPGRKGKASTLNSVARYQGGGVSNPRHPNSTADVVPVFPGVVKSPEAMVDLFPSPVHPLFHPRNIKVNRWILRNMLDSRLERGNFKRYLDRESAVSCLDSGGFLRTAVDIDFLSLWDRDAAATTSAAVSRSNSEFSVALSGALIE